MKATITLIGNATSYVSSQRRENILKSLLKSRSNLVKILQQVSWKLPGKTEADFFGEAAMDEVSKRVTILENFRKSALSADPKKNRFLGKGPATRNRGGLGQPNWYRLSNKVPQRRPTISSPSKKASKDKPQRGKSYSTSEKISD